MGVVQPTEDTKLKVKVLSKCLFFFKTRSVGEGYFLLLLLCLSRFKFNSESSICFDVLHFIGLSQTQNMLYCN